MGFRVAAMKFCVDCAYLVEKVPAPYGPGCTAPQANPSTDAVYGTVRSEFAYVMRLSNSHCGPDAAWFFPKPRKPRWWWLLK